MRLIDADNLKEQVKAIHKAVNTTSVNTDYDTGFHSATSQIMGLIEFLPTVEAKEVVHGRWIDGCCSNCGAYVPTDSRMDFIDENDCKFCYECGCDMRTSAE